MIHPIKGAISSQGGNQGLSVMQLTDWALSDWIWSRFHFSPAACIDLGGDATNALERMCGFIDPSEQLQTWFSRCKTKSSVKFITEIQIIIKKRALRHYESSKLRVPYFFNRENSRTNQLQPHSLWQLHLLILKTLFAKVYKSIQSAWSMLQPTHRLPAQWSPVDTVWPMLIYTFPIWKNRWVLNQSKQIYFPSSLGLTGFQIWN